MFKYKVGTKKVFRLFPFALPNIPSKFLKMQDAYNPSRYPKKYTADQFLFAQLILMTLTSRYSFNTIMNCLEINNPDHPHSSSGNGTETSQWMTCLIESIVPCGIHTTTGKRWFFRKQQRASKYGDKVLQAGYSPMPSK